MIQFCENDTQCGVADPLIDENKKFSAGFTFLVLVR